MQVEGLMIETIIRAAYHSTSTARSLTGLRRAPRHLRAGNARA